MREELPKGSETVGMILAEIMLAVIALHLFWSGFAWRAASFWVIIGVVILAYFVLFAACVLVLRRIHRPYPQGRCKQCGYDMRMSPKRCPECGKESDSIYGNL